MDDPAQSSLVISGRGPDGRPCLGLVANRAYRIQHGTRAAPLDDEVPVPPLLAYTPSTNEGALPSLLSDEATFEPHKAFTDVLLVGSAHARPGPVASLDTSVEVGAARKSVRVFGRRRIALGAGGRIAFTRPEPFTSMPLTWDHAYGGRDEHVERLLWGPRRGAFDTPHALDLAPFDRVLYPRNGAGRGYFLDADRERLDGALLPSLQDPNDPVLPERILSERTTQWIDRPVAACYAPIDLFTFPRSTFFLRPPYDTPERPVHELSTGAVLAEDLVRPLVLRGPRDPRVYNAAPAGLAVCRLGGGEHVTLWNLHRAQMRLEFDLPGDEPRLSLDVPGVGERRLAPLLSTVRIEPDADRVVLTWAAAFPVLAVYPDEMTRAMRRSVVWSR